MMAEDPQEFDLFGGSAPPPVLRPPAEARLTIQERFERFHHLNPWVFEALERLAADWVARGRVRGAIGMLWEVLRWHHARATADRPGEYKLNDHYRSRYARLLLGRHPEWGEFFELRKLRAR